LNKLASALGHEQPSSALVDVDADMVPPERYAKRREKCEVFDRPLQQFVSQ
jgi:hypothetical protein